MSLLDDDKSKILDLSSLYLIFSMLRGVFLSSGFSFVDIIDRINMLAVINNVAVTVALKECGFKDLLGTMKKGSIPSVDKFFTISDYFNVDVRWLLTG